MNVLPGLATAGRPETAQALTLPLPAGSETAHRLVRFVRDARAISEVG